MESDFVAWIMDNRDFVAIAGTVILIVNCQLSI